ncbi:phosphotransferase [Streptomyces sp. JH002]|uniref:phosphotransferase n=1 Tax=Streptomyces sp. JH002 TaxID=2763259 RepID=UPI003D80607C
MTVRTPARPAARELSGRAALHALARRYGTGEPLSCQPLSEGLLNRGYRLATTRGRYFLKQHLAGDPDTVLPLPRQHRATAELAALGLPVAPPLADRDGATVTLLAGHCFSLHPWIDGRHRAGGDLGRADCRRLGALLGLVHRALERVILRTAPAGAAPATGRVTAACPHETHQVIDDLLARVRHRPRRSGFDELAEHRLLERRALLRRYGGLRPGVTEIPAAGWVHGDFHPLNLLYRAEGPADPLAIIDWDRLGIRPRAEEAVRAAAIFFLRPDGSLELSKISAYARAYRIAAGADPAELAAAVHRVWWERLNDFWMLRWHYERGDTRTDPQFAAASALVVWWTGHRRSVRDAFCD